MKKKTAVVTVSIIAVAVIIALIILRLVRLPGEVVRVEADKSSGFNWTYYLYIPREIKCGNMIVIPNNTGKNDDDISVHEKNVKNEIRAFGRDFSDKLGAPLLMPVFPRSKTDWQLYTHALDRDTILTDKENVKRLDLQLINMIDDARRKLRKKGFQLDKKVMMLGFSASGMFTNRFTIIHPERVKAAAVGAPGGWPIIPVEKWDNELVPYPVGIGDLEALIKQKPDLETFKKVPQYFFIGDRDTNDSVTYTDGYEPEYKDYIFRHFGDTPVSRWPAAEKIYREVGTRSAFVMYKGVGHQLTPHMKKDVIGFFKKTLKSEQFQEKP